MLQLPFLCGAYATVFVLGFFLSLMQFTTRNYLKNAEVFLRGICAWGFNFIFSICIYGYIFFWLFIK